MSRRRPEEYLAIELWRKQVSGSYVGYIRDQQKKASMDRAPIDAIYYDVLKKRWKTVRDIHPEHPVALLYKEKMGTL